ncbi:MAG: GYD domain-containing protein [Desulfobacterales bacterium]
MPLFIILTRLSADAIQSPKTLEDLEKRVMDQIRSECPQVEWMHNFAVLGPYDYLDVFRAPDIDTAFKVSTIIRSFGHAHTEVWGAKEWAAYKELIRQLSTST